MVINSPEQHQLRKYLLGRLDDSGEEQVERRLLSDGEFFEEYELIEDELIDQYVQQRLSDEERVLFEKHLLQSPQQQQKLAFARALNETATDHVARTTKVVSIEPHRPQRKILSPQVFKIAAGIIVVIGIALAAWILMGRRPSDVDRGMLALNKAYKNERLVESRISEINYSPLNVKRGGQASNIDTLALKEAELRLSDAARTKPTAASYHALGRFYLAGGNFEQAKEQFEQALRLEPQNAELESDLGAAFLELGTAERNNDEQSAAKNFESSLEHINRALQLNSSLLDALFNRGLVLQQLSRLPAAEEAWRNYLQKDSTSPWSEEAKRHLRAIEEQKQNTSDNPAYPTRTHYI